MQTRTNGVMVEEVEDEWAIGHSLEPSYDGNLIRDIASEATALTMQDEDDGIFEMEL